MHLDFLQQQQQHAKRTVILSDILQSGKSSADLYADVATILQQKNINRFIGIGPEIVNKKNAFKNIAKRSIFFFYRMILNSIFTAIILTMKLFC